MKRGHLVEEDDSRPPPSGIRLVFSAGTYRALEPLPDLSSNEGEDEDASALKKKQPGVPLHDAEAMRSFKTSSFPVVETDKESRRHAVAVAVATFVATLVPAAYFLLQR